MGFLIETLLNKVIAQKNLNSVVNSSTHIENPCSHAINKNTSLPLDIFKFILL